MPSPLRQIAASHPPEVLADLCARLRRQHRAGPEFQIPKWSGVVYELTREELGAALHLGIFEFNRSATNRFQLTTQTIGAPSTPAAGPPRVWAMPLPLF